MATTYTNSFANRGVIPLFPNEAKCIDVAITPSATIAKGTVLGEIQKSDVWSISTGSQGSGTFTLTFGGATTTALARTISAANMQIALRLLATIGSGGCVVQLTSGTPGTDAVYAVTFTGALAYKTNTDLTADFSLLGTPGNASITHSITGQILGTFKAYSTNNTDGTGTARAICQFDVVTDSSGNITFGGQSGGGPMFGQTSKVCPVFVEGTFQTSDLTGLDSDGVTDLGRLVEGTLTNGGMLRMP